MLRFAPGDGYSWWCQLWPLEFLLWWSKVLILHQRESGPLPLNLWAFAHPRRTSIHGKPKTVPDGRHLSWRLRLVPAFFSVPHRPIS